MPTFILSGFRAETAHEIEDKAYQENKANAATTDERAAKVKPTPAEQKKQNQ
jgi:hypothetical protein